MRYTQQFYLLLIAFTICGSTAIKNANSVLAENKTKLLNANIQDCDGYYPLRKGVSFELTYFNKKDKADAIIKHKIVEANDIDNGVEATFEMSVSDMKGNPGLEMSYEAKCQNGNTI